MSQSEYTDFTVNAAIAASDAEVSKTLNLCLKEANEDGNHVAQVLQRFPHLVKLKLAWRIAPKEAPGIGIAVGLALAGLRHLKSLIVDSNGIGTVGVQAIATGLKNTPELIELRLGWNPMGTEGLLALAQALQYLPKLETLTFGNDMTGPEGIPAICKSIETNTWRLKTLNAEHNHLDGNAVAQLIGCAAGLPYLTDLKVRQWTLSAPVTVRDLVPM